MTTDTLQSIIAELRNHAEIFGSEACDEYNLRTSMSLSDIADRIEAIERQRVGAEVTVPREPTPAMLDRGAMQVAMNCQRVQTAEASARVIYIAMLKAAICLAGTRVQFPPPPPS